MVGGAEAGAVVVPVGACWRLRVPATACGCACADGTPPKLDPVAAGHFQGPVQTRPDECQCASLRFI